MAFTRRGETFVPRLPATVANTIGTGDGLVAGSFTGIVAGPTLLDDDALVDLSRFASTAEALTTEAREAIPSLPTSRRRRRPPDISLNATLFSLETGL